MASNNEYDFRTFRRDMSTGGGATALVCIISLALGIILAFVATRNIQDLRAEYKTQAAIVAMFDVDGTPAAQAEKRRELAASIIVVNRYSKNTPAFSDPQFTRQLPTIARTGEKPHLQPVKPSILRMIAPFVPWWLGVTLGLASLLFGLLYWDLSRTEGHFLCDLPWHRPWPWLVPTMAPWLVPALIVSYFRARPILQKAKAQAAKKAKK